jgi:hypothetical protein
MCLVQSNTQSPMFEYATYVMLVLEPRIEENMILASMAVLFACVAVAACLCGCRCLPVRHAISDATLFPPSTVPPRTPLYTSSLGTSHGYIYPRPPHAAMAIHVDDYISATPSLCQTALIFSCKSTTSHHLLALPCGVPHSLLDDHHCMITDVPATVPSSSLLRIRESELVQEGNLRCHRSIAVSRQSILFKHISNHSLTRSATVPYCS